MKKKVKIIGAIIIGLAAAGMAAAYILTPLSLEAVALSRTTAKVTFTEQGSYQYERNLAVYPLIAGEVLGVLVEQGQPVKKGDVLAVVLATDYEYQIKSLESGIEGYQAQIANLRLMEQEKQSELSSARQSLLGGLAEIELALKNHDNTEKSLRRQIELQESLIDVNASMANIARRDLSDARDDYRDDIISDVELNAARLIYNQAQAALYSSRQYLEVLGTANVANETFEAQRESVKAQLTIVEERIGRDTAGPMTKYYEALIEASRQNIASLTEKLGQAYITAPADGVVSELPAKNANILTPQSRAATISADPFVEVFVPIREIDGVNIGDKTELIVSKRMGDEIFPGTVTHIENEAQIRISALGVEERKVRVVIRPEGGDLRIGFNMDVRFSVFEQPDCVVVPKTAVFKKDGVDMVWVIEGGAAQLRAVKKGVETREGYAIISGLSAGESVVSDSNTEGLAQGKRVRAATPLEN